MATPHLRPVLLVAAFLALFGCSSDGALGPADIVIAIALVNDAGNSEPIHIFETRYLDEGFDPSNRLNPGQVRTVRPAFPPADDASNNGVTFGFTAGRNGVPLSQVQCGYSYLNNKADDMFIVLWIDGGLACSGDW